MADLRPRVRPCNSVEPAKLVVSDAQHCCHTALSFDDMLRLVDELTREMCKYEADWRRDLRSRANWRDFNEGDLGA